MLTAVVDVRKRLPMAALQVAVITIESLLGSVGTSVASVVSVSEKEKADAGQGPVHRRGAPIGTETVTAETATVNGEIATETEIGSETGIGAGATTVTVTGTETETDARTAIDVTATMETTVGEESITETGPLGETVAVLATVMPQPRVAAAAGVTSANEWLE